MCYLSLIGGELQGVQRVEDMEMVGEFYVPKEYIIRVILKVVGFTAQVR